MTPKTEPEFLNVISVGEVEGDYMYVLAETMQEAEELFVGLWGVEDYDLETSVLGPSPRGLIDSNIVTGRYVKSEHRLISWLLEQLRSAR